MERLFTCQRFLLFSTSVITAASSTGGLSLSEFDLCKLTNSGTEYTGAFAQTASNEPCQSWSDSEPHAIPFDLTDDKFPDGNKTAAQNYCRNPDNNNTGPWCYPFNPLKDREPCKVPTCSNEHCRWTGLGLEYSGPQKVTLEQKECSPWSTDSKAFRELEKYNQSFPEGSRTLASRGCRNPTEDLGGPWCFVAASPEISEDVDYTKQFCDVPFCFPSDLITVIANGANCYYSHYTEVYRDFDESEEVVFKLWNPGDWDKAELRIALSSLPIPATGTEMRAMSFGYEIIIENRGVTITNNKDEESVSVNDTRLINGLTWTRLTIYMSEGALCLRLSGDDAPFITLDLQEPDANIIGFLGLRYISYRSNVLMFLNAEPRRVVDSLSKAEREESSIQFEDFCPEHYTNVDSFTRYYPIRRVMISEARSMDFFVRGNKITVKLTLTPSMSFPFILIEMTRNNFTIIGVMQGVQFSIAQGEVPGLICYWRWTHMEIDIMGARMVFSVHYPGGIQVVLDQSHPEFTAMRWFSVASTSQAVWTFYCEPEPDPLLERNFPECIGLGTVGEHYEGHQAVTSDGYPCFPWVSGIAFEYDNDEFPEGTKTRAANFCRNPRAEPSGPWCFARHPNGDIGKKECSVRNCTYNECKATGTGDDYSGTLAVTRANKTCQMWTSNNPHNVEHKLRHDQTFAEGVSYNSKQKHNFCRNPSHDVGGPWCYTTDKTVVKDLCNVPDCQAPESCIIIATGKTNRRVFLDPQKKISGIKFKAKLWDPLADKVAKLYFTFYPRDGPESLTFVIGSRNGEYLKLYLLNGSGEKALLKQIPMPHVLSAVKWTGLKLLVKENEFLAKFSDAPEPFFTWRFLPTEKYCEGLKGKGNEIEVAPFAPAYFSYGSGLAGSVGFKFACDDCHTEIVTGNSTEGKVFYPMNLWSGDSSIRNLALKIYLRGSGASNLTFYTLPSSGPPILKITLNEVDENGVNRFAVYTRKENSLDKVYYGTVEVGSMFSMLEWTEFTIEIVYDKQAFLRRNGHFFASWVPNEPVYFFTVESDGLDVLYTVNCAPPDLDIPIIDGGWSSWSPWTCSSSCGGGRGFRTRSCTNPVPSILGEACRGVSHEIGKCNEFPCGRLLPQTLDRIAEALRTSPTKAMEVKELETISLKCSPERLKMIKSEEPTALIVWEKNSCEVSPPAMLSTLEETDFSLIVSNVTLNSTGAYACMLHAQGILTAVEIFTVVVRTIKPRKKMIGTKLEIPSNAQILGKVYDRLRVNWIHNDEFHDSYDFDLEDDVTEAVRHLKKEHDGIWECRVVQENLNLNWTTNLFMLEVVQKTNWFSRFIEVEINPMNLTTKFIKNETEMWIALGVLLIIIVCSCKCLFMCLGKLCCRQNLKYKAACSDIEPLMEKKGNRSNSRSSSNTKASLRSNPFSGLSRKSARRNRCGTSTDGYECFPATDLGSTA